MSDRPAAGEHTCGRCAVTASLMPGTSRAGLPSGWIVEGAEAFCLNCRRERAAEAVDVGEELPASERTKLRSRAKIEFEIRRAPDVPDTRIARACRTSTMAVQQARLRIGIPTPPHR